MTTRSGAGIIVALLCACLLALAGCTGGSESNAAEDTAISENGPGPSAEEPKVDAHRALSTIGDSIPIYHGARYRSDLTRRDEVMIRSRYGANAEVYTLATDDSFPQVYHYYTTYLAQFRAFPASDTYPPEQQSWRTLEVKLNDAMQDPFIPGRALPRDGKQVTLQIAETEAEPKTVIRYIVTPAAPPPPAVATASSAAPVAAAAR